MTPSTTTGATTLLIGRAPTTAGRAPSSPGPRLIPPPSPASRARAWSRSPPVSTTPTATSPSQRATPAWIPAAMSSRPPTMTTPPPMWSHTRPITSMTGKTVRSARSGPTVWRPCTFGATSPRRSTTWARSPRATPTPGPLTAAARSSAPARAPRSPNMPANSGPKPPPSTTTKARCTNRAFGTSRPAPAFHRTRPRAPWATTWPPTTGMTPAATSWPLRPATDRSKNPTTTPPASSTAATLAPPPARATTISPPSPAPTRSSSRR